MTILGRAYLHSKEELAITLFVLVILLATSSCITYYAEHDAQPDVFSSIPAGMWWSAAGLTTVGYGDTYPVTTLGKFMASVVAVAGIGMFALPTGIPGAAFVEEHRRRKDPPRRCPHCGNEL